MSDQPGIPAITVFPPFNPTPRQPAPVAEPARDQAPASTADDPQPEPQAAGGDVAAPAAPVAWDFEPPAEAEPEDEPPISDDEDLPWLEVPEQAPPSAEAAPELKADDAPNWMDWVRDAGPHDEEAATPVADLQPEDAQPWSPETETAADDWAWSAAAPPDAASTPPAEAAGDPQPDPQADPWQAPPTSERDDPQPEPQLDPWQTPQAESRAADDVTTEYDVPEPELYDLPQVGASAEAAAEPGWELPAEQPAAAPDPQPEPQPEPQAASGPFAAVADRLRQIADALSADPGAFLSGAQGGGDPLALLVAGFVLGYNARQGS